MRPRVSVETRTSITICEIFAQPLFEVVRAWKTDLTVRERERDGALVDIIFTAQPTEAVVTVTKIIGNSVDALPSTGARRDG